MQHTTRLLATALLLCLGASGSLAHTYPLDDIGVSDQAADDLLGAAVGIDRTQAILGAYGHDHLGVSGTGGAWILERQPTGGWVETAELVPSDLAMFDQFGYATAITLDRAIVGSRRDGDLGSNSGSAYIFERQPSGNWIEGDKLTASDGAIGHEFGTSVSIDGDYAVVGAPDAKDGTISSGSAYVFERQAGGTWIEVAKLHQSDPGNNDNFGKSVSISGTYVIVGAYLEDQNGSASGSAYLFERQVNGTWPQVAKVVASDGAPSDYFGYAVAISGDHALIGAWLDDDGGNGSGSAYVFERQAGGAWLEAAKLVKPDAGSGDHAGQAVAINGDTALVGAIHDTVGFKLEAGSASLFARQAGGTWPYVTEYTLDDPRKDDHFGHAVGISDGHILAGASYDNDFGDNAGSARLFFTFDGTGKVAPLNQGTGTPGCSGPQTMGMNLPPLLGTNNFALTCDNTPISGTGYLILADAADVAGSDPFAAGILLHVDPFASSLFIVAGITSDSDGTATMPLPLPNTPALDGFVVHAQTAWLWTACSLPPLGLSSSNLLSFTLHNP